MESIQELELHPFKVMIPIPEKNGIITPTGLCEKVPAKFGEESSVKADGLCIGCPSQLAEVGRKNSNMQDFFCTTLYRGVMVQGLESDFHHGYDSDLGSDSRKKTE